MCYFFIWKMLKFLNFNNLDNLKKLSNTLSVKVISKNHNKK